MRHQVANRSYGCHHGASFLFVLLAVSACAVDATPATTSATTHEQALMKQALEAGGFDTKDLVFNQDLDVAIVEGDIAIPLDDLREQIGVQKGYDYFGMPASITNPDGTVQSYTIQKISSNVIGSIKLVFDTPQTNSWATEPVNAFWIAAFRNAAQQWSGAGSAINISESNSGSFGNVIHIIESTGTFCDHTGDGKNDCLAMGTPPHFGVVGSEIFIDPTQSPNFCPGGWVPPGCSGGACFTRMIMVAVHEMGHTLGFGHPGCGEHIAGTATQANCDPDNTVYSTEMANVVTHCNDNGVLKSDDTLSARNTYPR